MTDAAKNTAKTRTFVIYVPESTLEADNSSPVKVKEATDDDKRWITDSGNSDITLTWKNHFVNKVIIKSHCKC